MTIHEPTVRRITHGENAWPTYEIDWPQGEPQPGDLVLMSAELFERSIEILSGVCHSCQLRMDELAHPRTPPPGSCVSCPNRDPRVARHPEHFAQQGSCDGSCAEPKCRNGMPLLDVDERLH